MNRKRQEKTVAEKLALLDKYRSMLPLTQRKAAEKLNISRGYLQKLLKNETVLRNPDCASTASGKQMMHEKSDQGPIRPRRERTIAEKLALLDKYKSLPLLSQRQAAERLNISRGLLQNLLKNEEAIRNQVLTPTAKRKRFGKDVKVDQAVVDWFEYARLKEIPVNGVILKQKANEIAQEIGHIGFKATDGWYSRWKKRHSISMKTAKGDAPKSNGEKSDHQTVEEILQAHSPQNIFNAHEAAIYFHALPSSTHIKKNSDEEGFHTAKDRVTLLTACSLNGKKEELLLVGKKEMKMCSNIKNLPISYSTSPNACMTSKIFENWLLSWDHRLQAENRTIVLFVKDCYTHKSEVRLLNISIHYIPSSTSSVSQPCEMGICTALKAYYRYEVQQKIIEIIEDEGNHIPVQNAIEQINFLEVMLMLKTAWDKIPVETIQSCWRIAGFRNSSSDSIGDELAQIQLPVPPVGVTAEQFAIWVMIDDEVETNVEPNEDGSIKDSKIVDKDSTICRANIDFLRLLESDLPDDLNLTSPSYPNNHVDLNEEIPGPTEIRHCLNRIRIGLQQTDFEDMDCYFSLKRKIDDHLQKKFV